MMKSLWFACGSSIASSVLLCACGGGGSGADTTSTTSAVETTKTEVVATAPASKMASAVKAAENAASTDALCDPAKLGDYYWEIGDADSALPLASGTRGSGTVTATTRFNIASASKFVFGAYVLEKKGIEEVRNNPSLHDGLRFLSGYTDFSENDCIGSLTIGGCFKSGNGGHPLLPDPNTKGRFYYNGGHDQKLAAIDLGMYTFTAKQLDQEYQATLGLGDGFSTSTFAPLTGGGLIASASDFAQFLRKVMRQQLVIGSHLGEDAVCTQPTLCPDQAVYAPPGLQDEPWSYSYNHWVESETGNGTVDAYSSPGKFGFYPWISPDRKYYGILSRHSEFEVGAGGNSARCGRQIRKAFLAALQATS